MRVSLTLPRWLSTRRKKSRDARVHTFQSTAEADARNKRETFPAKMAHAIQALPERECETSEVTGAAHFLLFVFCPVAPVLIGGDGNELVILNHYRRNTDFLVRKWNGYVQIILAANPLCMRPWQAQTVACSTPDRQSFR